MLELSKSKRFLFSILSGVLLFISFPFTGSLTFLVFISWIPLLIIESYISKKKYKSSKVYIHALVTFFIYNLGATWWIWNASAGGAIFAIVLNAIIMAFVFYLFHITKKKLNSKNGIFILPLFWISFEFIHYHWELSYPWLNLGNTFSITPQIVQWYSYTGVLGGTLWILICNILGFKIAEELIIHKKQFKTQFKNISVFIGLLLFPMVVSIISYSNYTEKKAPIEIVAIQPNIDPYNEKFNSDIKSQLNKLFKEADKKVTSSTDCVLAPETAISSTFYEDEFKQMDFYPYILDRTSKWKNALFFTGASTARFFEKKNSIASRKMTGGPGFIEYYNTSLLIDKIGNPLFVHKSKLVLGVEKIPFSRWIPWLEELSIQNGGTSGTLGIEKSPKVYNTPKFSFAPSICYESIYGGFVAEQCRKGSDFIFIITNDGWWGDTPGYKQHASFARLRAIENRKSIARSANTGISCFINQRGDVSQATKWWVPTAINGKINKNKETTFYTNNGDILGKLAIQLLCAVFVYLIARRFIKK